MKTSNKLLLAATILVLLVVTAVLITLKTQGILVPQDQREQTFFETPSQQVDDEDKVSDNLYTASNITALKSTLLLKMLLPQRVL
jgi:hypothetical protein